MVNNYYASGIFEKNYISHHGIKGQKWGVRRYQNPDGTLTAAGRARYGKQSSSSTKWATGDSVNWYADKGPVSPEKRKELNKRAKEYFSSDKFKQRRDAAASSWNTWKNTDTQARKKYKETNKALQDFQEKNKQVLIGRNKVSNNAFNEAYKKYGFDERAIDDYVNEQDKAYTSKHKDVFDTELKLLRQASDAEDAFYKERYAEVNKVYDKLRNDTIKELGIGLKDNEYVNAGKQWVDYYSQPYVGIR